MENECDGRVLRGRPMAAPTVKHLQIVRNGALRSYPRALSLALRAIHLLSHLRNTRQCMTKFHKQNRHIRRETSVCAGFRLQLRKILVSQLQIVRKQRPQPLFAAGTVPRYRRWTDPKPFSALFAG